MYKVGPHSGAKVQFNWNVKLYSLLFKAPIQNGAPCSLDRELELMLGPPLFH